MPSQTLTHENGSLDEGSPGAASSSLMYMHMQQASLRKPSKQTAKKLIEDLVRRYEQTRAEIIRPDSSFSETDLRTQFLDPLLEALGWDVRNVSGATSRKMEVIAERTLSTKTPGNRRPDYRLRIDGSDVMPVEAKRPNIQIANDVASATQARAYGWSLSLPASTLSNFEDLLIFNTMDEPPFDATAHYALLPDCSFHYTEYVTRFDDLWSRLSHASIEEEGIFPLYNAEVPPSGGSSFDESFLDSLRRWRLLLAQDIIDNNPDLIESSVSRQTQMILNAVLFLRVIEERGFLEPRTLESSSRRGSLKDLFRSANRRFNSCLFDGVSKIQISDEVISSVATEMYWPNSPYAYGVLDSSILSRAYEQYLGEQLIIDEAGYADLIPKPEVLHAGGVAATPGSIARYIVSETLSPIIQRQLSATDAIKTKILDPAVGSGLLLVEAFHFIVDQAEAYGYTVDYSMRKQVIENCLYGIDIDAAAVEVAHLSLALEAIGNSPETTIVDERLPNLDRNVINGNSVVDEDFYDYVNDSGNLSTTASVLPVNPIQEFGLKNHERFDAIVVNPPYVRIQEIARSFPLQLEYFQHKDSPYFAPKMGNFDLYQIFMERILSLLGKEGRMGMIVPHRFTNAPTATHIRSQVGPRLEKIVHFGELQLFPNRTTYTCVLTVGKKTANPATLTLVSDYKDWTTRGHGETRKLERKSLKANPWPIATEDQDRLLTQLESGGIGRLGERGWVDIFVGVQTSRDKVYFINPTLNDGTTAFFIDFEGKSSEIESALIKPAILDQSIDFCDGQPAPDAHVIFPYTFDNNGRARIISKVQMRTNFPKAFAYFWRHREILKNRAVSPDPGENFWAFGRSQSLTKMRDEKLIVRVLSLAPQYALDSNGLVVPGGGDGGPYYLLRPSSGFPYSINVLQALLSYLPVDLHVTVNGKKYRGSYASHRKAFLSNVPVPLLSKLQIDSLENNIGLLREISIRLRSESFDYSAASLRRERSRLARANSLIFDEAFGIDSSLRRLVLGD